MGLFELNRLIDKGKFKWGRYFARADRRGKRERLNAADSIFGA